MIEPYYTIYDNAHALIAGTTGSGKSYLVNRFIENGMENYTPNQLQFVFIDPKRCELSMYKYSEFMYNYSFSNSQIESTFEMLLTVCQDRFKENERQRKRQSTRTHIFVIIDEFVHVKTFCPQAAKTIAYLSSIARAANIHIVLCTQRPTRDIIPPLLSANFPVKIGLRTATQQESRNIIQRNGCETLPRFGYAFIASPERLQPEKIRIE